MDDNTETHEHDLPENATAPDTEAISTDGRSTASRDPTQPATDTVDPAAVYDRISTAVGDVLVGNETVVEGLTIALLTRGHVLLEGVPGVAKTTIANVFSRAVDLDYTRIQLTPDVLPADITGTNVYREPTGEFERRKGPVFANVVVADEINRATPKTQSALLEAMQERQVTIDGETLDLPTPFCLVATQNPIEMEGTFELPEAQRDRFALKYVVGLPDRDDEETVLRRFDADPELGPDTVEPVVTPAAILDARRAVEAVHVADPIIEYILDIVQETRQAESIEHGGSPRASLTFLSAAKARAAIRGRDYVLPDDIKTLVGPVLSHRLVRTTDARLQDRSTETILETLVESVPAPGSDVDYSSGTE